MDKETLLSKSQEFLTIPVTAGNVEELRDILRRNERLYYIDIEPIISDRQYDLLFKKLQKYEDESGLPIPDDSPSRRVAYGLTKKFESKPHLVPMLSLDNSYDEADLTEFDRRVKSLTGLDHIEYLVEPKLDGGSVSIIYENDSFSRALTRGDGLVGEEITNNIRTLNSIPLRAEFSRYGIRMIEIRGELVIARNRFNAINAARVAEGLAPLSNPRNAAAGSVRLQDSREVAKRGLEAILYHVSYIEFIGEENSQVFTRCEQLKMLDNLGFKTPSRSARVVHNVKGIVDTTHYWIDNRDSFPYEIDGLVIKVDNLELEEKLGHTSHHPRWAIAFKFPARSGMTRLLRVDFQVGRQGTITPVAKLEPVHVGGVTVSSVSLFNEDFIKEKDLHLGDTVAVERAGDVIPYISQVFAGSRVAGALPVKFPEVCPSCAHELHRLKDEAAWYCVNTACPAQAYTGLVHFASKQAMDISGLGKQQIKKFMEHGWLKTIPDIFRLPFDKILELPGYKEKSVHNIMQSIENCKNKPAYKLLFGLGIRHVGEITARALIRQYSCITDIQGKTPEQLMETEDVGPVVAESIRDFFSDLQNVAMIEELAAMGLQICTENNMPGTEASGPLSGNTILFTGTLQTLGRQEAKDLAERAGAQVAGSLSSKVNLLVVGTDPGSKVEKAKKMGTVRIISEDAFLQLTGKPSGRQTTLDSDNSEAKSASGAQHNGLFS